MCVCVCVCVCVAGSPDMLLKSLTGKRQHFDDLPSMSVAHASRTEQSK